MTKEEAITILDGFKHNPLFNEQHFEAFDMAISALSENKGEWIHPYRSDIACECSVCHIQIPITDYFHYCPNCGADMRGEE